MVDRIWVGMDGSNFRCRVSKPGYDVFTTDITNLLMMEKELLQAVQVGTAAFPGSTGSQTVSVSLTGFTYTPFVFWFAVSASTSYVLPLVGHGDDWNLLPAVYITSVSNSSITFKTDKRQTIAYVCYMVCGAF